MKYLIIPLIASISAGCAMADSAEFVEVPMDISSGRPIVDVTINGQGPFQFVVDTGAPRGGMISATIVDALQLDPIGQSEIGSPLGGEPVAVDVYQIDTLSIGRAESHDFTLNSLPGGVSSQLRAGVIGPALFDDGLVTFDFQNNVLRIGGEAPGNVTWIDFGATAPILDGIVSMKGVDMPAHIDTGAPHVVALPEAYAETLPLDGPVSVVGRARTIDKEFEIKGAQMNAIATIGDATIPIRAVTFAPLPFVNLGTGALRGLVLTIDWPNERYAIVGEAAPAEPIMMRTQRSVD